MGFCCLGLFVTEDKNILIVFLHKIPLTGNLLYRLRIGVEHLNLLTVTVILLGMPLDLVLQFTNLLLVLEMMPDTGERYSLSVIFFSRFIFSAKLRIYFQFFRNFARNLCKTWKNISYQRGNTALRPSIR